MQHREGSTDPQLAAVLATAAGSARTVTVDAAFFAGLVDATERAAGLAALVLGPEHGELATWIQRARDCARAA